jgi:peptide/nickel transport system substrate-binding protein
MTRSLFHRQLSRRLVLSAMVASGVVLLQACRRQPEGTQTSAASSAPPAQTVPTAPSTAAAPASTPSAPAKPAPPPTPAVTGKAKRGGTITTAMQNDWVSMDPIYNSGPGTSNYMIYDPLFFLKVDSNGDWQPIGGLIEKWDLSNNTATFNLRQGVKFHDGSDWNSDVLKWNFERMLSDPKSLARAALQGVDPKTPVTVVDNYTAKVNLLRPTPALLSRLTDHTTFMISKAAFEKMGAGQYNRNPVGTGPFKFKEWKPSDHVTVTRNENYWMKGDDGQPLPYLDSITYRLIIDDSVRAVEIKSHNIDFTELVTAKDISSIQADPALQFLDATWTGNAYLLMFNSVGGAFAKNLALRQAAQYAIDRETIAKTLGLTSATALRYMLLPGSLAYNDKLPYYGYDLGKAKTLMSQAGLAGGIDVNFPVISREIDKLQAEILKEMWGKIGIRANISLLERAAWVQQLMTQKAPYDVATLRTQFRAVDPDLYFRTFQWSKANFNVAHLDSQEMDNLIDKASSTYDEVARKEAYAQAQTLDYNLAYYGYIWMQKWNWVYNKRLMNVPPLMDIYWDFRGVWLNG